MVTVLQRLVLRTTKESPVDRVRQSSAFPPNYIHSIDSSHMMLTALACQRHGAHPCPPASCCRALAARMRAAVHDHHAEVHAWHAW